MAESGRVYWGFIPLTLQIAEMPKNGRWRASKRYCGLSRVHHLCFSPSIRKSIQQGSAIKTKSTPHATVAKRAANASTPNGLRGTSRVVIDAVEGVTNIVEQMHGTILRAAPLLGRETEGRTRGVTGLVYRNVRGVTRVVGKALDMALAKLSPLISSRAMQSKQLPQIESLRAVLNGVVGDYLAATRNPLAIPMQFRVNGQPLLLQRTALAEQFPHNGGRLVVLVHGLCMNDLLWERDSHDHGVSLAVDLGVTPIYLHYNTGLHIAENGRAFAAQMASLVAAWPVPVREIVFLCHSMGGLVARSACAVAGAENQPWLGYLKKIIFLGAPHHGARLERLGKWVDKGLMISPYSAPFATLGKVRSAGITDLGHARLTREDVENAVENATENAPRRGASPAKMRLPKGVKCYAIAASTARKPDGAEHAVQGDGLVQVDSALGRHRDRARALGIPRARQKIFYTTNHFALLSSADVYRYIRRILAARSS
jgi:pimeloyl-ACP methyl ester carboxylesterase